MGGQDQKKTILNPEDHGDQYWVGFLNGDDSCFEKIYNYYVGVLFRYGIQFTQDEGIVRDAIHDVFVRMYNTRPLLKKEVGIKFYLFTALKNCLYNIFKKEMFFEKLDESELIEILERSTEYKDLSEIEQESEKQIITQLLKQLTDRQREAIYYRYIEELSMEEIGALMDMNPQSVQNLIQRSLKKMRNSHFSFLVVILFIFREIGLF